MKKSGYKKLAKLLSTWEKKGALTTKVVHKQDTVVGVNRGHKARGGGASQQMNTRTHAHMQVM